MLHHLDGTTVPAANLVNYYYNLQEYGNIVRSAPACFFSRLVLPKAQADN